MLLSRQTIGEYKMTKSNLKTAVSNVDYTIDFGGKTFTPRSLANHGASVHEKLWLLQEDTLDVFKELGDIQIQLRLLYPNNIKFSKFIAGTDFANVSPQDRSDAKFIAENWVTIQKLNKDCKLDSLGVSSIRKKTKEFLNPEAKIAKEKAKIAKEKATAKAIAEKAADEKAEANENFALLGAVPNFHTPKDLADFIFKTVKANKLDFVKVLEELTGLELTEPTKKNKKMILNTKNKK